MWNQTERMSSLRLIFFGVLALFFSEANAAHILGGHITWECTGAGQYQITLTLFRDCYGASAPLPSELVFVQPNGSCGLTPFSANFTLQSFSEQSELCPTEIVNSSCNGGIIPGIQRLVYSGSLTLDTSCPWTLFWVSGDWNYFNNINFMTFPDAYISSVIDPTAGCVSSPSFTSIPVPYRCRNTGVLNHALTLTGTGGLTLNYSTTNPQTLSDEGDPFSPPITVGGYSAMSGLAVNGSGLVSFNSNGVFVGNYLATVQIQLFQGSTYVGTINHSFAITMRDCTSTPTNFSPDGVSAIQAPAVLVNPTTVDVCAGSPVCFSVRAINTNPFRTVELSATWPAGLNAGNPTFTQSTNLNPRIGEFCLETTQAMAAGSPYIIHFEATDDQCILPGFDDLDIVLNIYPALTVNPTSAQVCNGESLTITASGGASYNWTALSGNPAGLAGNGGTQTLTNLTQDASVQISLVGVPAQCPSTATVDIGVSLTNLATAVTDETCLQNNGAINLTVTGGSGNYLYNWNNGQFVTEDLTNLPDGQYCVVVTETSIPNCTATTCATVANALPPGGSLAVQGGVTTICEGQSATLVFTGTGDNTQPYALTVTGTGANVPPTINHNGTFTVNPPVGTTTYSLTSVSYVNPPACPTPANSSVTITVRPLVTGSFSSPGPICVGSDLPLTVQLSPSGTYNVTYTAVPADPPGPPNPPANPWTHNQTITFNPAATTTYTITNVEYTDAPVCSSIQNNATSVTVNPLPTASMSGSASICAGESADLTINLTGTGPWTVAYTANGIAGNPLNIPVSPFTWTVTPALTATYCITSVTDANGCVQTYGANAICETITVTSIPTASIAGGGTACAGSSVTVTVSLSGTGPWNFVYAIDGVDQPAITNHAQNTFTISGTVAGNYTLTSVSLSASGCLGTVSGSATVTLNPQPTVTMAATLPICAGAAASLELTLTGTGPFNLTTSVNGAPGPPLNVLASPFNWNVTPGSTSTYCITGITDATGCSQTYNNTVCQTVTVNPLPTASIGGNGTVCAGSSFDFQVSFTGASPWSYTMTTPGGDVPIAGPVTSPNSFAATAAGNYFVTSVSDANGCTNTTDSPTASLTVNPLPTSAIAGNGAVCTGSPFDFQVNLTGASPFSYVMNLPGGGTQTVSNPSVTSPHSFSATAAGSYSVQSVTDANGCVSSAPSNVATLTVNALPAASLSGATAICAGQSTDLTISLTGQGPWVVATSVNGVPGANLNVAASPFAWTVSPAANTDYCITTVTDANGCVQTYTNTVCQTVTVNPLPTAAIAGNGTVCAGSSFDFQVSLAGSSPWSYTMTTPGGDVPVAGPVTSPHSFAAAVAGSYFVTSVTDSNGCVNNADSPSATLTVNPLPTATIDGPGTICAGQSFNFGVTFVGGAPFTFDVNGPAGPQVGLTSAANAGTFGASTAGNYTITSVTDNIGCNTTAVSPAQTLTVNALPTAALSGAASICAGQSTDLSVTLTGPGPWIVATSVNGAPGANLNVAASPFSWTVSPVQNSDYCITSVTDANGCVQTYTNTVCQTVTVNPLPTASIGGNGTVCDGDAFNFQVSFTGASPWSYTMTTPTGDVPVAGPVTSPNSFSATTAGNYFVTSVTDSNGCVNNADSPTASLTVNPLPTATIDSPGSICAGQSFTFGVTFVGAAPFTFDVNGPSGPQNGLASASNNGTFSASAAGNYTITSVTDNIGCNTTSVSPVQTLTVNALPTAAISGATAICAGQSADLTITLTGPGPWVVATGVNGTPGANLNIATSPFTWTVSPATNSDYCITSVTDANACAQTYTNTVCQTITVNPLPTAAIAGNGAVCAGSAFDFQVSLTGSSPWSYTMTTPGGDVPVAGPVTSPNNFSATAPGNYFVTSVTDANGCTNNADSPAVSLTVNPLPTAAIAGAGNICAGQSFNFQVTLTGASPYTYVMNVPGGGTQTVGNPAVTSPHNFAATVGGSYSVQSVTDANGCASAAASNSANLNVNPLPAATLTGATTICAGQCADLQLTLNGTGPWTVIYTINGGANQNLPPILASPFVWNLCPATTSTYCIVSITDSNGCVQTYTNETCQTITVNPLPTATWTTASAAYCAGSSVGITFNLVGGAPWDVSYTIDGTSFQANGIATSPHTIQASTPGNYCIESIADAIGCPGVQNECIIVDEVPVPLADAGPDVSTCVNAPVLIGTPAVAGVNYSWSPQTSLSNGTIAEPQVTSAAPGPLFYTLTASITASGITCQAADVVNVTVNALPVITVSVDDDQVCFNTPVQLTGAGAGPGGSYAWTAGTGFTSPTNVAIVTAVPAGTVIYSVEGTDANGCFNSASVSVFAGPELLVNETFSANLCFGACDGSIGLTPSGGFGGYSIQWGAAVPLPGQFAQADLCAGVYPYTVTDAEGCTTNGLSIDINELPENFVDNVTVTPTLCSYDTNGQIQVFEAGAQQYTLYNCVTMSQVSNQTGTFGNLAPADCYDVMITDSFGCTIDVQDIVVGSSSAPVTLQVDQFTNLFCFGELAAFTGTGSGGSGNLIIEWHDCPQAIGCLQGTGVPFNYPISQNTTLYAVVLDANNCRSNIASVTASMNEPITLSLQGGTNQVEICSGECVTMQAAAAGGNSSLNVQWFEVPDTINDTPAGPSGNSLVVCPDLTTQYYAYASDGCNVPVFDTLTIVVFQTPDVLFAVDNSSGCSPLPVQFTNLTDPALSAQCVWNFGNGVTLPVCGDVDYNYIGLGAFTPSLTVTSPDGCVATQSLGFPINVYGYPEIDFTWEPADVNVLENEVSFTNLTENGATYNWSFATFGTSTAFNPVFTFPAVDLATYTTCLQATTANGCSSTLCKDITIGSILQVWVPNAFTPDQDGLNEAFIPVIKGHDPDKYRLLIFNRWGTLVFETRDPKQAWMGNIFDGEHYPQGDAFVWRIEVERLSDGVYHVFEGTVTMVR